MGAEPRVARDLLQAAQTLLERPPRPTETWADRVASVRTIASELDVHGVDGLSLIRFGMQELFVAPVLGSVAFSVVLESRGEDPHEATQPIDVAGWRASLGLNQGSRRSSEDLGEMLRHAGSMIEGWAAFAPVDTLVRLAPVPREQLAAWATAIDAATRAAADVYRWLVERSLGGELDRWSTPSLKLEYRYSVKGEAPTAPESFLATARMNPDALAHALAARILREETEHELSEWVALLAAVQKQAKMLLRQGRCAEAAALFDFLIGRHPSDPALRNNLAFCLLTSKPAEAMEHLRDAQRMGFEPRSLLLYNRACCATTEAIRREVLFDANRYWVDDLEPAPVCAFIWKLIDGAFVPTDTFDVRIDLATAAIYLALELGELVRVPVWEARLAALQPAGEIASAVEEGERR